MKLHKNDEAIKKQQGHARRLNAGRHSTTVNNTGAVRAGVARMMWTALWLVPVGIIGFLIFLVSVQNVTITGITMDGDIAFTPQEIKRYAGISFPAPYLEIDVSKIKKRLENHPLVYSAHVKKTFKGELIVRLTRSIPLVAVLATVNDVPTPVYFDKKGKCVQVGSKGGIVDVPIVSGVSMVNPHMGVQAPPWVRKLLLDFSTIKKENSALFNSISEFKIVSHQKDYKTLEVWFTDFKQKYILPIELDAKILEDVWLFADRINREQFAEKFDSFDVRQGVIIGKRKEKDETTI